LCIIYTLFYMFLSKSTCRDCKIDIRTIHINFWALWQDAVILSFIYMMSLDECRLALLCAEEHEILLCTDNCSTVISQIKLKQTKQEHVIILSFFQRTN